MQKKEAISTTRIMKWFLPLMPRSAPWEVKHTRGAKNFRIKEIAEHQWDYLYASTTDHGFSWKAPDAGFGYNPCDVMAFKNTDGWFIVTFPLNTYVIHVLDLLPYKDGKPITEDQALKLSRYKIENKKLPK